MNTPLNPSEQRRLFVSAYLSDAFPKDIIHELSDKWLDPEFKWSLGLLEWRPYGLKTKQIVSEMYGFNHDTLKQINYGISKCITHKQFDIAALKRDIMESSPNTSWLVYFISQSFPDCSNMKGIEMFREKHKLHSMLYEIVSMQTMIINGMQPIYSSNERDIRVMALACLPSPQLGFELTQSLSISMSPLSLPQIMSDLENEIDESFILDTFHNHLYPERDIADTARLQSLLLAFNRIPSTNEIEYVSIDVPFDEQKKQKLMKAASKLLAMDCYNNFYENIKKPFIMSKVVDMINKRGIIMNIINIFTELRMATHYIEMFKRNTHEWIENNASISIESESDHRFENILTIGEFLRNYPLFETLRANAKYGAMLHCITSTITYIVNKVIRPLPFHPTHIINDSYCDFLMYTSQISRFVYNKIVNQNRFNKFKYLDNIVLNNLQLPVQLDIWIIPQCVSEYKLTYLNEGTNDTDDVSCKLLFGVGDQRIASIGDLLSESNIDFKEFSIDREPAQFYKTLTRGFDTIQKMDTKRYKRYVFIIDRRNPSHNFDGEYCLNNSEKNWKDKLYIYCPPKYNQISSNCDITPEGFINRTMQYLLPLGSDSNSAIGGNSVANGYVFCESYHLFQEDKVKRYFHHNGYAQRFGMDELKYYFPRLFMKIDGKMQNELNLTANQVSFDLFKEIKDEEHTIFHRQTMK